MKVLLTGAGGFLGRFLVGNLVSRGLDVIAVSSQDESRLREIWAISSRVNHESSIQIIRFDEITLSRLSDVDIVVNAGFARVASGTDLARGLVDQHLFLEMVARSRVRRLINISSQSVYNPSRVEAAKESDEVYLSSPYSTAKFAQELAAETIVTGKEILQLRLASLIGPGFDQRFINKLIAQAVSKRSFKTVGGNQIFDFMDVRDAAQAIALLTTAPVEEKIEIINIGSRHARTIAEIGLEVEKSLNHDFGESVDYVHDSIETTYQSSALNVDKLFDTFKFSPLWSLQDTIKSISDEYMHYPKEDDH